MLVTKAPFTQEVVHSAVKVLLGGRTAPRSPHFVLVVHTTGGRPLIGHGFLTVNNSRMTLLQTLVTKKQLQTRGKNKHVVKLPIL